MCDETPESTYVLLSGSNRPSTALQGSCATFKSPVAGASNIADPCTVYRAMQSPTPSNPAKALVVGSLRFGAFNFRMLGIASDLERSPVPPPHKLGESPRALVE